jgi:hypothetical protein
MTFALFGKLSKYTLTGSIDIPISVVAFDIKLSKSDVPISIKS